MIAIAATLVVIILTFALWYRRDGNLPPGPRGIPILGVIPFLGKFPTKQMRKWNEIYGRVASVRMGYYDYIALCDYETINEVYVKQGENVKGKPKAHIFDSATKNMGILVARQSIWNVQRPFTSHTLKRLGMGKKAVENLVQEELACFVQEIEKMEEKPIDIKDNLLSAMTNIIYSFTMKERFEYDDKAFQEFSRIQTRGWQDLFDGPMIHLLVFSKILQYVPPFNGVFNRFIQDYQYLYSIIRKKIEEHKESYDKNEIRDFIDVFLEESMKENADKTFFDEQLVALVKDLFDGGTQTSSTTILWGLLILVQSPKYQDKLRAEIDAVVGPNRNVTMNDREHMPYTLAFYHEVMRKCTVVPFSHMRTTGNVKIGGYKLKPNTQILANIWAVHNNPKYFDNPSEFRPERFIDPNNGSFVKSRYWIPFSVGRRNCVGDQLGHMQIFAFLVKIIQKFNLVAENPDQLPSIDNGAFGIVYVPKERFKVRFIQREA